ncbi:MAG: formimidoylglutamase [Cryomorphaceae bacterium]|jgi:arginase family enzyme|nr:formimidoylglutamase [Cryomorphaceae bacterium]
MKDLSIYFAPIERSTERNTLKIGGVVRQHTESGFPDIEKGAIAIIYVPEFRGSKELSASSIPEEKFRDFFYGLHLGPDWKFPLYDLGNILPGSELKDTQFALAQVITELIKNKVLPVVVGGSQDLTIAMYKGYEKLEQTVNICCVDYQLDLGDPESEPHSDGYVSHLLLQRPCYLFNLSNIGMQAPFVPKADIDLFEKLYFDVCRLGEFNADFKKAEPHLRNSDLLSIDFKSIRASELFHSEYISPNGLYADQMCQITKYAGISDKLTSLGIFNYFPEKYSGTSSFLLAQMIWYFMDGVSQRRGDFPVGSKKDYLKFTVFMEEVNEEIIFYKSNKSERWWMEVPYPPKKGMNYERHHLVPCDKDDYELAMKNEIPDLWWKTYQKLG